MGTLTETITSELLDAMDSPGGPEVVLTRYSRSKGPLYSALARATDSLTQRLSTVIEKTRKAEHEYQAQEQQARKEYQESQDQIKAKKLQLNRLQQQCETKAKELMALDEKLDQRKELLDQAESLAKLGFGLAELVRLRELLAQVASSKGVPAQEGIAQFFHTVEGYENIVSMDLEAKRAQVALEEAKANAGRWQAEAKAAEAKTKVRKTSIDVTEKLLAHGVKESDLPVWTRILAKSGVSPEGLAQSLEQHASLEKLCLDRQQRADKLEAQARELDSQVKALNAERQQLTAAIGAVKEEALAAMECVSQKALEHVEALSAKGKEYGELERAAAGLEHDLTLARAFKSQDTKLWQQVPRRAVQELLTGLVVWSRSDRGHNPSVPVPAFLSSRTYFYSWEGLRLEDLLLWALSGAFTDEERKALASGR